MIFLFFILTVNGYAINCGLSYQSMNFWAYDPFSSKADMVKGSLVVRCTGGRRGQQINYSITLSAGFSGNCMVRSMRNVQVKDTLKYNVYSKSNLSIVWGGKNCGSPITGSLKIKNDGFGRASEKYYGSIPPSQDVSVGKYLDNLVLTLNF